MTPRQVEILVWLADHKDSDSEDPEADGLLVYERGIGYIGASPVAARTFFALLRLCAIRRIDGEPGGFEVYEINETGLKLIGR